MEKNPVFTVIGPGVMGEAIIAGLIRQKVALPEQIIAAGPEEDRQAYLQKEYGIQCTPDNQEAAAKGDVILIAVKPQRIQKVLVGLHGKIPAHAVIISIVAGSSIKEITDGLNHMAVVRAMPNTPAQIGEGITVWTTSAGVSEAQCALTRSVLASLGEEVYMDEEEYLDMATALSGSGPAYAFLFMEAMIDAGVHLGFQRRIAEKLVVQTLRGSVNYYDQKKDHAAALRSEVTSPGGTSAEALYYLEKAGIRTAISRAIWAAFERSRELGAGKKGDTPV
ncbi:MAG: pyrroline-5-carboxylate reductase [Anaerolineaceae bacterium]|nr:pyrroline-5-carboxylate reductase [Anaerolineaceae bacterium]